MDGEASVISFHGPDGCGKSTLAAALARELHDTIEVRQIGGSSFRQWLTPDVAGTFGCNTDLLDASRLSDKDKTTLYEDIAVACYGLSNYLKDQGSSVIIDSDPYLKRQIWARLTIDDSQEAEEYLSSFEEKVNARIGTVAPDQYVIVDPESSKDDIFTRLQGRGIVSEYDPQDLDELERLMVATQLTWNEYVRTRRFEINNSKVHVVLNRHVDAGSLDESVKRNASELKQKICTTVQ